MMGEYICTGVYNAASTIDENTSESESESERVRGEEKKKRRERFERKR